MLLRDPLKKNSWRPPKTWMNASTFPPIFCCCCCCCFFHSNEPVHFFRLFVCLFFLSLSFEWTRPLFHLFFFVNVAFIWTIRLACGGKRPAAQAFCRARTGSIRWEPSVLTRRTGRVWHTGRIYPFHYDVVLLRQIAGGLRSTKFCWVGKHTSIIMKPTNSQTQGQPNPRKNRLKVAFGPLFPTASIFSWVGNCFMWETDCKKPNQTKFSAYTLVYVTHGTAVDHVWPW